MGRMGRFLTSSIRRRMLSSFAIVVVVVLAMATMGWYQLSRIEGFSGQVIPNSLQMALLQDLALSISSLDANVERYLVIGGLEFQNSIRQDLKNVRETLSSLNETANPDTRPVLEKLEETVVELESEITALMKSPPSTSREMNEEIASILSGIENAEILYQELSTVTLIQLQEAVQRQKRIISNTITQFLVLSGAVSVIVVVASLLVTRSIATPLANLSGAAARIAEGDLTVEAPLSTIDETGQLAQAFNNMTTRLHDLVGSLELEIAERKRTEGALRESEARYRQLLEQTQVALAETQALNTAVTAATSTLRQNEAIERILEQLARVVPYDSATVQLLHEGYVEIVGGRGWSDPDGVEGMRFPIPGENPNTVVIQERRLYVLDDVASVYPIFSREPTSTHIRSWMGVPLIVRDRLIGMMAIDSTKPGYFSDDQAQLVAAFASQVAIAIENARLYEETKRQAEEMTALYHTSLEISSSADLSDLLWTICDRAAKLLNVDKGGLYLYDEARQELELVVSYRLEQDYTGIRIEPGQGVAGRVVQTGQSLVVSDYSHWSNRASVYDEEPFATVISAPLKWQEQVIGVITLAGETERRAFTAADERMLDLFAHQAAVAIESARLYDEAQQEIAERKRAEAEREALIEELETKNAELERFVYTVSHDLKSPLITIRGFLGFLEQAALEGDVEQVQADMERITGATDKMHQLLNELLELSRIGRLMNPPEEVPLGELAWEAVDLVKGRLEERGIEMIIAPDLPVVYGDHARLVEVLQNLVDNAIKYMGDQSSPHVEIGVRHDDGERVFFVRDNGIGIKSRYHERVFELFEKLNPEAEGAGVGLAIVKRIVEVHGGRIWVESEGAGKGSTFCFTLGQVVG